MPLLARSVQEESPAFYAEQVRQILGSALAAAARIGITRKFVASKLGLQVRTVNAWCAESHEARVPTESLVQLIVRDDILPLPARMAIVQELGLLGGFTVHADTQSDRKGLHEQVTDIAGALGRVAEAVQMARTGDSEGGAGITREERRGIVAACDQVIGEAEQLKQRASRRS